MSPAEVIDTVLASTQPLRHPRGERLPLYVWALVGVGTDDDQEARERIRRLDARRRQVDVLQRGRRFDVRNRRAETVRQQFGDGLAVIGLHGFRFVSPTPKISLLRRIFHLSPRPLSRLVRLG